MTASPVQDVEKQGRYGAMTDRGQWLEGLVEEDFHPADLRCLIKVTTNWLF